MDRKLPPIRVLADELGISINTVRNAYKRLEQQGWVVTRPHSGTIVQTESMDKKAGGRNWSHPLKTPFIISFLWTRYGALWTRSWKEIEESKKKSVIFVYEGKNIGHRFAMQIAREADVQVEEVHLDQLRDYLEEHRDQIEHLDAIITTYFQYAQVREHSQKLPAYYLR